MIMLSLRSHCLGLALVDILHIMEVTPQIDRAVPHQLPQPRHFSTTQ
jgi:hypothetical protein